MIRDEKAGEKHHWPEWPMIRQMDIRESVDKVQRSNRWAVSGYWTGLPSMEQTFSQEFAAFNGAKYCVPTTNGSSALLIALEACDIGYGDEVLVPALTWLATATAVLNVNAKPVLVDVEADTYCLDPAKVESAITDKTKAIIVVHLFCCLTNMDEIMEIAHRHSLKVIEDCAQSHGSVWNGKRVGTIGHVGTFSFQQAKVMTSGEGGATITNDPEIYQKLEQLRSDSRTSLRDNLQYGDMELVEKGKIQGSNFCLSEIQAALLLTQLHELDYNNRIKEENAAYLNQKLEKIDGVMPMKRHSQVDRQTVYGYVIRFDFHKFGDCGMERFYHALADELKLGTFYMHTPYTPIHKNVLFCPWTKKRYHQDFSGTEKMWRSLQMQVSEKAPREALVFHHAILLSLREDLDRIVQAIASLQKDFKNGKRGNR